MSPRSLRTIIFRRANRQRWLTILSNALCVGIVACLATTSTFGEDGNRVEVVRRWDFGVSEDPKSDRWPDDWIRRTGIDYPKYIPISIAKRMASKEEGGIH